MKTSIINAFLALSSYAFACMGPGPCHDGPPRLNLGPDVLGLESPLQQSRPKPSSPRPKPSIRTPARPNYNSIKAPTSLRNTASKAKARRDVYETLEARGYFDDIEEYVMPSLPSGVDPYVQHMFVRLNTIPKAYPPVGEVDHSGLNKLMLDLGGQHVDLVYGNPHEYRQCGMNLVDMEWTETYSNADGYPVFAQCSELWPGTKDEYLYVGEISGHNISRLANNILRGQTYDHRSFHCATFVVLMLHILGFLRH